MHVAWDGDRVVGGAGTFTYRMSVPGGIDPGRRRDGRRRPPDASAARSAHRDDAGAARRQPCARRAGRLPVGVRGDDLRPVRLRPRIAHRRDLTRARRARGSRSPFEPRGTVRLLELEEAAAVVPAALRPVARAAGRACSSGARRGGRRASSTTTRHGAAAARCTARCWSSTASRPATRSTGSRRTGSPGFSKGTVTIQEVVTPTPEATRELWRWLFDFDWTSQFVADLLPLDHPLFLLLAEPRRMQFKVNDGVWVRLDRHRRRRCRRAATARTARSCSRSTDAFLPENAGRYKVGSERGGAHQGRRRPAARRHRARFGLSRRLRLRRPRARVAGGGADRWSGGARRRALPHRHRALVRRDLLTERSRRRQGEPCLRRSCA